MEQAPPSNPFLDAVKSDTKKPDKPKGNPFLDAVEPSFPQAPQPTTASNGVDGGPVGGSATPVGASPAPSAPDTPLGEFSPVNQDPNQEKFNAQGKAAIADYQANIVSSPVPQKVFAAGEGASVQKPDGTMQDIRDFKIQKDFEKRAPELKEAGRNVQQYTPAREAAMKEAGTWTPDDEIRKNQSMYSVQGEILRGRMTELTEKIKKADASGLAKREQSLTALGEQIKGLDAANEQGQPVDPNQYNALVGKYNSDLREYQSIVKPLQEEKADIDAGLDYLRQKTEQSIKEYAASPAVRDSKAAQAVVDSQQKKADDDIAKGNYLTNDVIRQYVIKPVSTVTAKAVTDVSGAVLRALDTYSQLPNSATGTEYYTPFAKAADEITQASDNLTKYPQELEKSLLNDDWSINTSVILPKFLQAATYMAILGGAGAIGGEAAMVGASYLTTEEDYYREGIGSGLKPDQSQRLAIGASTLTSLLEKFSPGPLVKDGTIKKTLMKEVVEALKGGSTWQEALKKGTARVVKEFAIEGLKEGGQEGLQGVGDVVAKNISNTLVGDNQLDGSLKVKDIAEQVLLGGALGGLAGSLSAVSSPLRKQSMDWAVRNEDKVREFISNSERPDKEQLLKNLDAISAIYKGNGLTELAPDVSTKVASDIQAKQEVEKAIKTAPMDEALKAAKGDPREKQVEDLTRSILEAQGIKGKAQEEALVEAGVVEAPATETPKKEVSSQDEGGKETKATVSETDGVSAPGTNSGAADTAIQPALSDNGGRDVPTQAPTDQAEATSVQDIQPKAVKTDLTDDIPDDPKALAMAYYEDHLAWNSDENPEYAMQQALAGRVSGKSYDEFGDPNNRTASMAKFYFAKKDERHGAKTSYGLDQIAQELSESLGKEVTPGDLVAFMDANPSGIPRTSPRMRQSQERYKGLTGKKLDKATGARMLAKQGKGAVKDPTVREYIDGHTDQEGNVNWQSIKDEAHALGFLGYTDEQAANILAEADRNLGIANPGTGEVLAAVSKDESNAGRSSKREAEKVTNDQTPPNSKAKGPGDKSASTPSDGEVVRPTKVADELSKPDQERQALTEQVAKAKADRDKFKKGFTKRAETLFDKSEVATKKKAAEPGMFDAEGDTRSNSTEDLKKAVKPYDDAVTKAEQALTNYDEKVAPAKEKAKAQQTRVDEQPKKAPKKPKDIQEIDDALGLNDGPMEQRPDVLRHGQEAIGVDGESVARERFDIPSLEKIGSGSDRVVYDLGDGNVLKVAKTARGLEQNIHDNEWYLAQQGLIPKPVEAGLNYVVTQKVSPAKSGDVITYEPYTDDGDAGEQTSTIGKMLEDLSKFSQKQFDDKTGPLQDVLNKYGLNGVMDYNLIWNDFTAKRNWGVIDGHAVHLDGGTFGGVELLDRFRGKKNMDDADFREVYQRSRAAKKEFGDTDKATMYQRPSDKASKKTGKLRTDRVVKALSKLAPGVQIHTPATPKEFAAATKHISDGVASSWGVYDPRTNEIFINPEGKDLRQTLFHEAAHPVIIALAKNNPELFTKFHDEVMAHPEAQKYRDHAAKYKDQSEAMQMAEALAEFMGDVGAGRVKFSKDPSSLWQRFKDFINTILEKLGFKNIDLSQPRTVRDFATQFAKAVNKGIKIDGLEPVGGKGNAMEQRKSPKEMAAIFQKHGWDVKDAKSHMAEKGMDEKYINDVADEMQPKEAVKEAPVKEAKEPKRVKKTFATIRAYEGEFRDEVKKEIKKGGLYRLVENQEEAIDRADKFIGKVGIEAALDAVKAGDVKGGAATTIWIRSMEAVQDDIMNSEDPQELQDLFVKQGEMVLEFSQQRTEQGQASAILNALYEDSELRFNSAYKADKWETEFGEKPTKEMMDKWREQDKVIADLNKKYAEAEKRANEAEAKSAAAVSVEAIKEAVRKEKLRQRTFTQKAKSAADTFRKLKTTPIVFKDANGNPINITQAGFDWNGLVELGAKAIEKTGQIADGIAAMVENLQGQAWYVAMDDKNKTAIREQIEEQFRTTAETDVEANKIRIPKQMIRDAVAAGASDIDTLVAAIKEEVKSEYPEATDRDIRDAITEYGKVVNMSRDQLSTDIRRMKRIGKMISALEDIQAKIRPLRSGLQRDKLDAEERAMSKQLKDALKELPTDSEAQDRELRTALDAAKTRARNRIEDLQREIGLRERIKRSTKSIEPDAELEALIKQKDELQKEHDKIFGDQAITEEERLKRVIDSTRRALEKAKKNIEDRNLDPQKLPPVKENAELRKLRDEMDAARKEYKQMQEDAGIIEKKRLDTAKKVSTRRIQELKDRISNKEFGRKEPRPLVADNELIKINADKLRIQEEYDKEFYKHMLLNRSAEEKAKEAAWQAWGLTRALQATFEFSFLLIQGGSLGISNLWHKPKATGRALKNMAVAMAKKGNHDAWLRTIKSQDWYPEAKMAGLALTEAHGEVKAREELFMSEWTSAIWSELGIPLLLKSEVAHEKWKNANPFEALERGAAGYLDTLRVERYLDGISMLEKSKKGGAEITKQDYKDVADVVNTLTGRASLGAAEVMASTLTKAFFSPRLWASAIKTATPYAFFYLKDKGPTARKLALMDLGRYIGTTAAFVTAAALHYNNDDDDETGVELDPRSSDFLKIKVGNTRIDPWGGRIQQVVFSARVMAGVWGLLTDKQVNAYKNAAGELNPLGVAYKSPTLTEVGMQMATNKLAPSASLIIQAASTKVKKDGVGGVTRETAYGQDYNLGQDALSKLVPIYWSGVSTLWKDQPNELGAFLLMYSFIGGGVQTYGGKENKKGKKTKKREVKKREPFVLQPLEK